MNKRGKKYLRVAAKVDRTKLYPLVEAIGLAKETSYTKFSGSVDVAINLGVDPKHADQNLRGATALPHGTGRDVRVVVFAKGEKAVEAGKEDVVQVGADDLAEKISGGWLEFDQVIATPDMMAVVGKLGRVLGPRGLMPNPKLGTVTFDVGKAVRDVKAGRAEFRVDKAGVVHAAVGTCKMETQQLQDNAEALIDALVKAKPASAKGMYLKRMCVSSSMGPGVKVDLAAYR